MHFVRNPRSGQPDCEVAYASAQEVAAAAADLRSQQPEWAGRSLQKRCEALSELAAILTQQAPALTEALVQDTGRYTESLVEVQVIPNLIRSWIGQAPELLAEKPPQSSFCHPIQIHSRLLPYPVVGVISPWNFPLLLSLIDAVVALLAGCSVLVKPSEVTPRFIAPLQQAINQVASIRPVLKFITGDAQTGAALCEHSDMLCFTGSLTTGRSISAMAGRRMIPASLELGGKDAAIVFEDADLERAAKAICWGGFTNAGQACQAIERVYVQRPAYERFVSLLVGFASKLTTNQEDLKNGDIGPVISERQVTIIRQQLQDAIAGGAKCLIGGELIEAGGFWCPPTVLVNVKQNMDIIQKETFATILPVLPFDSEAQAIALANDTEFGLSAAVFSHDQGRALRVSEQLQVGAVSINDCALTTQVFDAEKNSFKGSGLGGSRMGQASIRRFLRVRALLDNPSQAASSWWYPSLR